MARLLCPQDCDGLDAVMPAQLVPGLPKGAGSQDRQPKACSNTVWMLAIAGMTPPLYPPQQSSQWRLPLLTPSSQHSGFTLLELLLVLVIVAVAATLVAPAIGNRFTSADPRLVMVQLRATMEFMRVRAIEEGKEEVLVMAPEDGRYWHEGGGGEVTIPIESGELVARGRFTRDTGEVEFHFYPDGTNSGGEVRIGKRRSEGGKVYHLVLNPLLGTASIRREN